METGVVIGSEIAANKDGKNPRRLLQVIITDPEDVQTVEWMGQPGRDSGIAKDDAVLIGLVGSTKFAFGIDDQTEPSALDKEERWFSRDPGGSPAAEIILRTNGDIELNGNTDFVISFNQLQIIMTNLAAALNAEFAKIATAINSIVPGSYIPGTIIIDLTPARVLDVKIKEPLT